MTQNAQFIATILEAALEAAPDPARRAAVLNAVKSEPSKPRMGTLRDAAAILGTCTRTAERYARQGLIPRVHLSKRMVRYDLGAASRLFQHGAAAVIGGGA